MAALGRPKSIESPEKLYEYFLAYKNEIKSKPFIIKDWVGKDSTPVYREKEKPLTMEGFECWLFDADIISDLSRYMANTDNKYEEFSAICTHIKKRIREDQISGGMSGMYNPSITQRLNSLTEKSDVTSNGETVNIVSLGTGINPNESNT